MRISIFHSTLYQFPTPVAHGLKRLRLKPKSSHGQQVIAWDMTIDGATIEAEYDDHNNNHTALISIHPGATSVAVSCTGTVETANTTGVIGPHSSNVPLWSFLAQSPLTRPGPKMRALAAGLDADRSDRLGTLHALSAAVLSAMRYETGQTDSETLAETALNAGHGVCQDHSHVFVGAARLLGIPARYVAGYLLMDEQVEQDAGHAWAEAHVDGLGWVGFDISNAISPDERYVRVATGCDFREAAPITGIATGGGTAGLSVRLAVERHASAQ